MLTFVAAKTPHIRSQRSRNLQGQIGVRATGESLRLRGRRGSRRRGLGLCRRRTVVVGAVVDFGAGEAFGAGVAFTLG